MNQDFNFGRRYERQEILVLLEALSHIDDPEQLHAMILAWQNEILKSLTTVTVTYESSSQKVV